MPLPRRLQKARVGHRISPWTWEPSFWNLSLNSCCITNYNKQAQNKIFTTASFLMGQEYRHNLAWSSASKPLIFRDRQGGLREWLIFRNCLMQLWELVSPKPGKLEIDARIAVLNPNSTSQQAANSSKISMLQSWEAFYLLQGISVFAQLRLFNWWNEAHPHYWG